MCVYLCVCDYVCSDEAVPRHHLPVDVILRPPPPAALATPLLSLQLPLPPPPGPSGLLSEEEFYREKQRLLSQERGWERR